MSYLGEGSQIPFVGKSEILKRVEELIDECWDSKYPVNLEAICDYLGIAIVPINSLSKDFGLDAYISADFKTIFVDKQGYLNETPRYRFSLAHELGHFILHREYFSSRVDSFDAWRGLVCDTGFDYVEYQANYFAGNLLAPEGQMISLLNSAYDGSFVRNFWNKNNAEFEHTLYYLRRYFKVSKQVIERRVRDTIYGFSWEAK